MKIVLIVIFLGIFWKGIYAEEKKTEKLEVIGVKEDETTKRGSTRIDPNGFVDSIDAKDFKGRYVSLADVLERETGVRVRRFGGLGSYSTLSIRGSNPNQVKIYIDGIPLNNAQGGEINLSDLNFDNLERIDIYKSGFTSGFNSSAIGGTVNLITKKENLKRTDRVNVGAGSFNTYKISGTRADTIGKVGYSIFVQKEKSDQNFIFRNDNGTYFNRDDDRDIRRKNAQFDRYSFTGNVNFIVNKTEVSLLNDFNYRENGIPGIGNNQTEKVERQYLRNTTSINTNNKKFFWDWLELGTRTYYTGARDHLFDPRQEFTTSFPNSRADIQQYGIIVLPTIYLEKYHQTIRLLASNERETFKRDRRDRFDEIINRSTRKFRNHSTLQIADEIRLFQGRLSITPMLQYESFIDRFNEEEQNFNTIEIKPTKKKTEYANQRVSVGYVLFKNNLQQIVFKSNASKENRIPDFFELFGERGSVIGNLTLRPEKSRNWDLGIAQDYKKNELSFHTNFSIFRKSIQDMILFIPNSQFTVRPDNIDSADIRGFEISNKLNWKEWRFQSNYTYTRAINTSSVSYLNGKFLPLRPLHEWHGLVAYKWKQFHFGFEPVFIGATFRDRTNEFTSYQDARWIYNLFFNIELYKDKEQQKEVLLGIDLRNVLDNRVFDIIGYPLPGRNFYATLSATF
ncbi:MAG: TonB-dependent receptor plug domain-containing protein [Leptospiraceae bacterium]|nr:TonB-dependent receptor plug domain-containing protein [Leptospiraceae bacterium]